MPVTAGGRGAPCAGEPAQESLLKEERGGELWRAAKHNYVINLFMTIGFVIARTGFAK